MTRGQTPRRRDEANASNMADAAEYLSRAAAEAGFETIALDLLIVRDKLKSIARSQAMVPKPKVWNGR